MARLIVIKNSVECNTKSKINPTREIIIPDNVGFRLPNLDTIKPVPTALRCDPNWSHLMRSCCLSCRALMKQRQRVPNGTDVHWSVSKWYIDINSHTASQFERVHMHEAILW
jgi:hypothetical protein